LTDNFKLGTGISMNASPTSGTFAIGGNTSPILANYIFTSSGAITVNLTGIPYSNYSIYAFSSDATAGHQNSLAIGGNTYYFTASTGSTFSQITNSNSASHPVGNYAVATGLSGANQTVTVSGTPDTGFSGFEIVNTANSLANSPVTISGGGTFNMNGGMQSIASLNSTDGNGSQVVLGNGNLTIGNAGASTFDGVISGSGGQVALQGAGSMLFTGSNTYTGPTAVSGGGTLQLGDGVAKNGNVAGNITLANNSAVIFANPTTLSYSGAISGTGSLTANGPGNLQLTAKHTYNGPTVINGGVVQLVQLNTVSNFGAATGSGTANGVNAPAGVVVHPTNGTWTLNTYGGYSANPNTAMVHTPVTGGTLDLTDGTASDSAPGGYKGSRSAFYNTPLPVNTSFNATFTYSPSNPGGSASTPYGPNYGMGFAFIIQNDSRGASAIAGAARGMGVGNDPEISANNVPIGHSAEIAYDVFPYYTQPSFGWSMGPSVLGAGTGFNTNGGTGNSNGIVNTNLPIFGGSANTYISGNNFTVPGDPINMTVSYNALTNVLTWSGTDAGPNVNFAGLTFSETQTGVNLQTITGSNMAYFGFSGADGEFGSMQLISNFNYGSLIPSASNVLPSTTPLFIAAGGTLDLYGVNQTVGDLSGSGAVTNTYSLSNTATLTVGSDNTSQTFSGTLQDGAGVLALAMTGSSGSLTLTGTNAYSGGTYVYGGTLIATNSQAIEDGTNLYIGNNVGALGGPVVAGASTVPGANSQTSVSAVPEPGTLALVMVVVLSGAAAYRRRRGRSKTTEVEGV
jgi:autotransporter-associated beta strand protein